METIREVIETLIHLIQSEILEHAVLVSPDDVFEITETPSLVVQGPVLTENRCRRTQASVVTKDVDGLTYERRPSPRLYHLDFDLVMTTVNTAQLLDFQEKVSRFFLDHPVLTIGELGTLNLTEWVPLGGLHRVNLSNLKQSAGKLRLEDCPVYSSQVESGRLVVDRIFKFHGGLQENRAFTPHDRSPS